MTEADGPELCALYREVFGVQRRLDLWRWFFCETPAGPGHGVVAVHHGRIVAHAGTVTRGFLLDGVPTRCGQSIDAMTAPDWQRRGLNRLLSPRLFERLAQEGVEVVYGFSNRNSTPGALRYQGRRPLEPFPFLFRPLAMVRRPWRVLWRTHPPLEPRPVQPPDGARELWEAARAHTRVGIVRDPAYLAWRYRRPGGHYLQVEARRGGRLEALGVLGIRWQAGLRTAFVAEALVADDSPAAWQQLGTLLLEAARADGCDAATALAFPGHRARKAWIGLGFLPVPQRFSPEDIALSVRSTRPLAPPALLDPTAWTLAWGEHDLV